jgi:hypothetical protein
VGFAAYNEFYESSVRPEVVDHPYQAKYDRADSADRPAHAKYEVCDHVVVSRPAFDGDAHIYGRPEEPEDCDAKRDDEVCLHIEATWRALEAPSSDVLSRLRWVILS